MSTSPRTSLERTLAAASSGSDAAWRDLVDAYAPRVFALLRSQCSDPELAEEVTQSAFCSVAAKLGAYAEVGRFEAWLFRIAMNRLRDEMRRRRRHAVSVESDALAALPAAAIRAPEQGPEEAELALLRAAMARLSEADRQIIHLRHAAGLSFKQIADVLEEPLGTVLARQHRALQKLADLMREPSGPAAAGANAPQGAAVRNDPGGGVAGVPRRRQ